MTSNSIVELNQQLDDALHPDFCGDDFWIARPHLAKCFKDGLSGPSMSRLKVKRRLTQHLFMLKKAGSYADAEGVLIAWKTTNQYRALGALPSRSEQAIRVPTAVRLGALKSTSSTEAKAWIRALEFRMLEIGDVDPVLLRRLFRTVSLERSSFNWILQNHDARCAVVAAQDSVQARSVCAAAREASIPTVYIPHAPFNFSRNYADIPTDYAALRGVSEIDSYRALGADANRLFAVGCPSLSPDSPANKDSKPSQEQPIVVAPSPWNEHTLGAFFRTLSPVLSEVPHILAPHPRSNRKVLMRQAPGSARLLEGKTTAEVLQDGAKALIQHSSGVALEGMLRGVPVIELTLGRQNPHYPCIREPHAYLAGNSEELSQIIRSLDTTEDPMRVSERMAWAKTWCEHLGYEAQQKLDQLLAGPLYSIGPVFDAWRRT